MGPHYCLLRLNFPRSVVSLSNPAPILAGPMLVVAVIGLVVNLVVVFVLREHDHDDLNTRAAFLHVLGDALSSVGVLPPGWSSCSPAGCG